MVGTREKERKLVEVKIKVLDSGMMPEFKRDGDVCMDCHARLERDHVSIPDGTRCLINLGFAMELPEGFEAVVRPRSGLSFKGLDVAIGTVDTSYRGEVKACVINNTGGEYDVYNGDRICQLAVREIPKVNFLKVMELSESVRGSNGFGSSGI